MNNQDKNQEKNRGFTIVETLVAVAILMIAIAGPLTIAQKSLISAIYAKDQVTATFLAQDAIEYVKNMRDANVSRWAEWVDQEMAFNCGEDGTEPPCNVDTTALIYNVTSEYDLYLLDNRGYFPDSTQGGKKSIFSRQVYVTPDLSGNGYEAKVKVIVKWRNGKLQNAVTLEEQIFNVVL